MRRRREGESEGVKKTSLQLLSAKIWEHSDMDDKKSGETIIRALKKPNGRENKGEW